jgi:hypothetical protein
MEYNYDTWPTQHQYNDEDRATNNSACYLSSLRFRVSTMAPQKEVVLKLTSMRYRKEGISEEDFHEHASKVHGPKAAIVQARHGAVKVTQVQPNPRIRVCES